ncbi:MAG: hypothetical protein PWP65_2054 [Clostridia bacterium]|nr:hypothetical protein [Clostridia bacterium]
MANETRVPAAGSARGTPQFIMAAARQLLPLAGARLKA